MTAVDYSSVGLDKARSLAAQRGVQLHTELADLTEWHVPAQPFDALVLVFVHLPAAIRTQVHQRLLKALKPGALVLIEAFTPKATLNKPSKISAQTWMTQFFGLLYLSRGPFGQFAGR